MPIHKMALENSVFFAKEVGYVDHVDTRMWANALENYAKNSDAPLMALIEAGDVDRLCPTAVKVFTKLLTGGNVIGIALVISDAMASRNASVLGKLDDMKGVYIFTDLDQARRFSESQVNPTIGYFTEQSISMFAAV